MHKCAAVTVAFQHITFGLLLFASMLSNSAVPITIAVSNYHPYNNEQGQGLVSDLYRAAFAEVDQPITIITTPIRRGVSMLLNGQIDALSSGNMFAQGAQRELITWTPTFKVTMASFFLKPGPHAPHPLTSPAFWMRLAAFVTTSSTRRSSSCSRCSRCALRALSRSSRP